MFAQLLIQLSSTLRFFVSREITDSDVHGKSGHHAARKTVAGSAKRDFYMGFFKDFHSKLHAIVQPVPRLGIFACSLYLALPNGETIGSGSLRSVMCCVSLPARRAAP